MRSWHGLDTWKPDSSSVGGGGWETFSGAADLQDFNLDRAPRPNEQQREASASKASCKAKGEQAEAPYELQLNAVTCAEHANSPTKDCQAFQGGSTVF